MTETKLKILDSRTRQGLQKHLTYVEFNSCNTVNLVLGSKASLT